MGGKSIKILILTLLLNLSNYSFAVVFPASDVEGILTKTWDRSVSFMGNTYFKFSCLSWNDYGKIGANVVTADEDVSMAAASLAPLPLYHSYASNVALRCPLWMSLGPKNGVFVAKAPPSLNIGDKNDILFNVVVQEMDIADGGTSSSTKGAVCLKPHYFFHGRHVAKSHENTITSYHRKVVVPQLAGDYVFEATETANSHSDNLISPDCGCLTKSSAFTSSIERGGKHYLSVGRGSKSFYLWTYIDQIEATAAPEKHMAANLRPNLTLTILLNEDDVDKAMPLIENSATLGELLSRAFTQLSDEGKAAIAELRRAFALS